MYRPRPLDTEHLTCHICGKTAKWRDRVFGSTYVLGEALCDACEKKFTLIKDRSMKFLGCPACVPCNKEGEIKKGD